MFSTLVSFLRHFFCRYSDPFNYNYYRPGYPSHPSHGSGTPSYGMQGYGPQRENEDRNWQYQADDRNRYSQYENR